MIWVRHHLFWVILVAVQSFLLVGCGSSGPPPGATGTPSAQDALSDLASLLNHFQSQGKPPPATIAQIALIEPGFPNAYLGLVRNEVVYLWGQTIEPAGGSKVLAYEKAVETTSGYVLMQDGTVKTMQSAEFQAAPKAGK